MRPRERTVDEIWINKGYFTAIRMDVFVTKLRKYLSDDPNIEIKNIYGSEFFIEVKPTKKEPPSDNE